MDSGRNCRLHTTARAFSPAPFNSSISSELLARSSGLCRTASAESEMVCLANLLIRVSRHLHADAKGRNRLDFVSTVRVVHPVLWRH